MQFKYVTATVILFPAVAAVGIALASIQASSGDAQSLPHTFNQQLPGSSSSETTQASPRFELGEVAEL